FTELLEYFLHARRVGAVILLDQLLYLLWRRHDYLNVFAKCEAQVLTDMQIKWIDESRAQRRFAHVNRQAAGQPSKTAGNQTKNFGRNFILTEIDEFSAKAIGNRFVEARLINEATIDHGLRDGFAVQFYFAQYVVRLRRFQHTLLDKKFGELFFSHRFVEALEIETLK